MLKRKQVRERGKVRLSQCFQELKEGDKVSIVREHSFNPAFPKRIQGLTGVITGKRGDCYLVQAKDINELKTYILAAIHLKKIN